nr:MAG TPA: hypothetical protein [Caudoviricetes sp.]
MDDDIKKNLPAVHEDEFCDDRGRLRINKETLELLASFGALYWSTDDMAAFFGIGDYAWWQGEVCNQASVISRTIKRGELEQRARVELGILKDALKGSSEDIDKYQRMMRDKSFALSKLDLFGGSEDPKLWQNIQDYISNGSKGTLSDKEQRYIDLLNLIFSLDRQFGKRKTVKFLTSQPFDYTHSQASNLYSEAVELFYCNRKISREALREKTADMYDNLYQAAVQAAKSTADYMAAAEILKMKAKLLRLEEEEVQKLNSEVYARKPVILSLRPEDIGLESADRRKLAEVIDKSGSPESEKRRLSMEAGIIDFEIEKILRDESQEAG